MEERPRAAGASGLVVHVREYPSTFVRDRLFPRDQAAVHFGYENVLTRASFYSGLQTKFSHRPWLVPWSMVPAGDAISVSRLNGCFGVFRREALFEVGLFDPRLFLYFEEDDLALRLRTSGWALYVTARTVERPPARSEPQRQIVLLEVQKQTWIKEPDLEQGLPPEHAEAAVEPTDRNRVSRRDR